MDKTFSSAPKNPADWDNKSFNRAGQLTPRPMDDAKRDAANDARETLAAKTKNDIGNFTEPAIRDAAKHDEFVDYVRQRLAALSDDRC